MRFLIMKNYPNPIFTNCSNVKTEGSIFYHHKYSQCRFCCQYELCKKWYDLDNSYRNAGDNNEPITLPAPSLPVLTKLN